MHNHLSKTEALQRRARLLWHRHRSALLWWTAPVALMAVATYMDSAHLGRWALLAGMAVTTAWCSRLARYVVTRLTQIVALWEEDVPQAEGAARLYAVPARHRGHRAKADA